MREDSEEELPEEILRDPAARREWIRQRIAAETERAQEMMRDPALRREGIRQNNTIYLGLIGLGTFMTQPFLSDLSTTVDTPGKICVISFSVAIPLLAALVMINWQETFRGREANSRTVGITRATAQLAAFVGAVAGVWHIWWIAGVVFVTAGMVALFVHSAGYMRVERHEDSDEPA